MDREEAQVLTSCINSFLSYKAHAKGQLIQPRLSVLESYKENNEYSDKYSTHLQSIQNSLTNIAEGIESNGFFFDIVAEVGKLGFLPNREKDVEHGDGVTSDGFDAELFSYIDDRLGSGACSPGDVDKVRATLKQVAREWSSSGSADRQQCYGRILNELQSRFPLEVRSSTRVLVPGCGLARLPFDLVALGFFAQGNEFSYHMLITSCLILNNVDSRNQYRIYPYIHSFSNHRTRASQTDPVLIPDVNPRILFDLSNGGEMSMAAGSFDEIYPPSSEDELFDVIATSFFIDTSPDIFKTLQVIYSTLKSGGTWVNFGPLLWHFEESNVSCGLELSLDEVLRLVTDVGFRIEKHESSIPCQYTRSGFDTLGEYQYRCEFWVAIK